MSFGRLIGALSLALAVGVTHSGAGAQVVSHDLEVLAADGAPGDQMGYATALSGDWLVLGAPGNDDLFTDAGSVYVFDLSIDSPFGTQKHELHARDADAGDNFGVSVAVQTGLIVVGANTNDDLGLDSGAAYLFDPVSGTQGLKLLAPDGVAGDLFGSSVGVEGIFVAVGAHGDDDRGSASGAVYVYDASIDIFDNGALEYKLAPADGNAGDFFGYALAMGEGLLVVGAYSDDDLGADSGSVYVYDAPTGVLQHKLHAVDGAAGDQFGFSVAVGGGVIAVGAPGDDDGGAQSGSVYLFDSVTGLPIRKLVSPSGGFNQQFGFDVALSGGLVGVGVPFDDDNGVFSGSAFLFEAGSGAVRAKLLPSDGGTSEQFGYSLAMHADTVAVGTRYDIDRGALAGAAYLFEDVCPADVNGDGVIDNGDLSAFIAIFLTQSPATDFNNDGVIDNGDIAAFITAFLAGC